MEDEPFGSHHQLARCGAPLHARWAEDGMRAQHALAYCPCCMRWSSPTLVPPLVHNWCVADICCVLALTCWCARLMRVLRGAHGMCTVVCNLCMRNQRDPNRTSWLVESHRSKRRCLKVATMAGARSLANANPLTQFAGAHEENAR